MAFIPVSSYVKLLKSTKIFQSYDHKCTAMLLMSHSAEVDHSLCSLVDQSIGPDDATRKMS